MGQLIGPGTVIIKVAICTFLFMLGVYMLMMDRERISTILSSLFQLNDIEISGGTMVFLKFIGILSLFISLFGIYFFLVKPLL